MARAKVLKIPARGEWSFAEADADADGVLTLEAMQDAVGGWVECWWLGDAGFPHLDMMLNEEGKLKEKSYNPKATILSMILMHDDCIVGDAFVCGSDGDGNSVGLTEAQELALRRRLSELGI